MAEKYNKKPTEEDIKKCSLLVLCKKELYFQAKDGDTILIIYPVGKTAAEIISEHYNIELMEG